MAKSSGETLKQVNLCSLEKTLGGTFAIHKYLQRNNINERSFCSPGWQDQERWLGARLGAA